MALVLQDRVKETTTTVGTGTFTLNGSSTGFVPFSVIGNGNETYYTAVDNTTGAWEVGIGTYNAGTLTRDTVLASSDGGTKVGFAAGSKDVFVAYPAEKAVTLDTPQTITDKTLVSATVTSGTINNTTIGATTPASGAFTTLVASGASLTSVNAGVALLTSATVTTLNATGASIASANIGNLQFTAASIASINAGVAVITNLSATSASIASMNAGVALLTTATVTTLNATGASIASANIGNLQFTAASIASINAGVAVITNLTATGASIASANVGTAVITAATVTGASIASANVGTAVITTGTVTNLTSTSVSVASINAAVALITTGTVTALTATGASVASANVGTAVVTGLTVTNASIASLNAGTATVTTGNLTFSSTGQRITGDMSNATLASRLSFQSSTTNGVTSVQLIPNGTATTSNIRLFNGTDTANSANATLQVSSAETTLTSGITGTGTYLPMTFYTSGTEKLRIAADATGTYTFSGTAPRITGDFSNATIASRLMFQTSTANSNTAVENIPSGTSTTTRWTAYNNSDPTNASFLQFGITGTTEAVINSGVRGTGTYVPITFQTNGSERMRLDTSGNLGIGTASPVAGYRLNVVNDSGNSQQLIRAGTNFNSTIAFGDQDSSTSGQLIYAHNGDYMAFNTNAAERMRIDSSGNVGIGTASPSSKLSVGGNPPSSGVLAGVSAANSISLALSDNTNSSLYVKHPTGLPATIGTDTGGSLAFATNGFTERMRIDSSGNVGIGGTASAEVKVHALGTYPTSGNVTQVFRASGTVPSGSTTAARGFVSAISTDAAAFTVGNLAHFYANQGTIGATSAVTNQYGFFAESGLTGATNNFGFYSNIASGSNRWNFYAAGTADNYFAGRVFFTSTNATPAQNNVEGMAWTTSKNLQVSCEGDPLYVNRKASDGSLVNFLQDGTAEGSISVAGNTVSYNPFMGSHYTEIVGAIPTLKGTVLESLDELVNGKYSSQDRLPKAKVSDTVGSSAVYGVYFAPDSDPDTNDGVLAAALGASWVRIAAGVTVQRGDLLESNGDGCAKVQSDDIIRSKTIGKVTSTTVADTYADGSYIVPCVLYCG